MSLYFPLGWGFEAVSDMMIEVEGKLLALRVEESMILAPSCHTLVYCWMAGKRVLYCS